MEFIVLAALCSVLVSILIKALKSKGFEPLQMIVWNYSSASLLCFLWFKPDLAHLSVQHTPWWLIVLLGIALPSVFLLLAKSLQYAGIVKTELAQRLSVVLSLLAAFSIFQEHFNAFKLLGIILGLFAIGLIMLSKTQQNQSVHQKSLVSLVGVWSGYALIDILLKYTSSLGLKLAMTLNLVFIAAFVFSFIYTYIFKKETARFKNMLAGLVLGGLNFANIALYVQAHILLKNSPAIVFVGMNLFVVIFGILSGLLLFKEKAEPKVIMGLVLGMVGIICLAQAM
ncbi:drug/metabolite transporter (DMT)-like permease [Acinetobacter baylyi]|uniref:Drug/metabolite transporter (DMT)-like permease n=1 Tax=Acinetobacter baylyi TaxID=202950 RepID=A0ABU0US76_ACIBI|nr:EamA family transporter [Acinetobacter baylyi]MDQ1207405.1 drug/metabolite transporter (DMT)-like permease [Acinetobacter baylyi]MDR6105514.1 drug/metabolite transporter (DMT)-like permease [Acinetobacter baylyi]MDR6184276.1 drug/metabolite transporter (DMT)-like permease [Acinetobacter baylyi]